MDGERAATLHRVITAIQRRWGERALRLLGQSTIDAPLSVIPTGLADLDHALGIGGLPRGRLTEVMGAPTSGATSIVLQVLAQAQSHGDRVGYIDVQASFDPEYAAWCGVALETLLLVRPQQPAEALDILYALVTSHGLGVLVVTDLGVVQETPQGAALLSTTLRTLVAPLAASPCALIVLTALPYRAEYIRSLGVSGSALAHAAAVRLHVVRVSWLDGASFTCSSKVTILKHKFAGEGATVDVAITFSDGWRIS